MKKSGVLLFCLLLAGCATSFSGSARVDGPDECRKMCGKWDMDLVGMVAMGEYTNGCICKVRGAQLSMDDVGRSVILGSAGSAGSVAGVYRQMKED